MNAGTSITMKHIKGLSKALSTALLLLIYLGSVAQIDALHELIHPEEIAITHSPSQEKSACHRALYHGQKSGCSHEFHLVKISSCSLSHTLVNSDQLVFIAEGRLYHCLSSELLSSSGSDHITAIHSILLSRGPPAFTLS